VLCLWLRALDRTRQNSGTAPVPATALDDQRRPSTVTLRFVSRLGLVMLVMYFSANVSEPFFSVYWEGLSGAHGKMASGLVYALPGVAALVGLLINQRRSARDDAGHVGLLPAVALAVVGLALEASQLPPLVLGGRPPRFLCSCPLAAAPARAHSSDGKARSLRAVSLFRRTAPRVLSKCPLAAAPGGLILVTARVGRLRALPLFRRESPGALVSRWRWGSEQAAGAH
jgi:hypothetical protein